MDFTTQWGVGGRKGSGIESRMGITKGVNYRVGHVLQSGSTLVITWGRYYTLRQLLQSSAVQKANKRNGGEQQNLAVYSLVHL